MTLAAAKKGRVGDDERKKKKKKKRVCLHSLKDTEYMCKVLMKCVEEATTGLLGFQAR